MTEPSRDDKQPSFMQGNPWLNILSQRGRDQDPNQAPSTGSKKPTVPDAQKTGNQQASFTSTSKKPHRGPRLLKVALQGYELYLQHFSQLEIAATLGVSGRQVHNYIRKARAYLGVPEGLKHAALAEIMLAIKLAWGQFYLSTDPRTKAVWHQQALRAMIHRDRLLGLLDGTVLREEIKT